MKENFHAVWVHSDPELVRFEDTFTQTEAIRDLLVYTGFVAESGNELPETPREKRILLSMGGGIVGEELYRAAAPLVEEFSSYRFDFVFGPYTSPALKQNLAQSLAPFRERVGFLPLLKNFEAELSRSALSLSLAGYNTVMNLLHTRTPALVLPYDANIEQRMRAKILESRGYLQVLEQEDLQRERFSELVRAQLRSSYPASVPDLLGAEKSREHLLRLLGDA